MEISFQKKNSQQDGVVNDKFIRAVEGTCVPVPGEDIDTDRIIPARFLTSLTFEGLGALAFYDERFDGSGNKKEHPFNDPCFSGAAILVVNSNFGCGSSREHAPQALMRRGIRAIVGESFAGIFADNCCSIGMPVVRLKKGDVAWVAERAMSNPSAKARVSIGNGTFEYCNRVFSVVQDESFKRAFLEGRWDAVYGLVEAQKDADKVAQSLPYLFFNATTREFSDNTTTKKV